LCDAACSGGGYSPLSVSKGVHELPTVGFCFRSSFPPSPPGGLGTWKHPSAQGASAVPCLSLRLRTGATAHDLGRRRSGLTQRLGPAWCGENRPFLQRPGAASTSKPAKAGPGSEDNPVRLRAYLRQAGKQEPSVHLSIPHRISCGKHVEALPAVAGNPSGESLVTFLRKKVTPRRGERRKASCVEAKSKAFAQRKLSKEILHFNTAPLQKN